MKINSHSKLLTTLFLLVITVFTACKDEEPADTPAHTDTDSGTYTIMLYASACGATMDDFPAHYITDAIYHGLPEGVNMTAEIKFSNARELTNMRGISRLDIADQSALKGSNLMPHTYTDFNGSMAALDQNAKNIIQYGDTLQFMNKAEEITSFIEWSRAKHPADHYILLLVGHGKGWSAKSDGKVDGMSSRSSMSDSFDSTKGMISLDQMTNAISLAMGGEKIDALFLNNCVMETLENYTAYADIAKYVVGTFEVTQDEGTDVGTLLDRVADVSRGTKTFFDAMAEYCDHACSDEWFAKTPSYYCDIAVTDLSKMGSVNEAFKAFADFAVANYDHATYGTLGVNNVFDTAIRNTLTNVEFDSFAFVTSSATTISYIRQAEEEGAFPDFATPDDRGLYATLNPYGAIFFLNWLENKNNTEPTTDGFTSWLEVYSLATKNFQSMYVAADYMQQIIDVMKAQSLDALAAEAETLREKYMEAVKASTHAAATNLIDGETPYDVASFAVSILPASNKFDAMIPQYADILAEYQKDRSNTDVLCTLQMYRSVLPSYYVADGITPDEVLGYYRHTLFNAATRWDRFLALLSTANSYATAVDRKLRSYYKQ